MGNENKKRTEGGYTGNIAADLISGAINHYRKHNRTIKVANLSGSYWRIFRDWMSKQAPELEITNDGIQFNNLLVRKGSMFQRDSIVCELNPLIDKADAVATEDVKVRHKKIFNTSLN